jgi:hypothetical protein
MRTIHGKYGADVGSRRIETEDAYFLLNNGVGDGKFTFDIVSRPTSWNPVEYKGDKTWRMIGAIGVTGHASIANHDCVPSKYATIPEGVWWIYLSQTGNVLLVASPV